jgi:hypothetical protein
VDTPKGAKMHQELFMAKGKRRAFTAEFKADAAASALVPRRGRPPGVSPLDPPQQKVRALLQQLVADEQLTLSDVAVRLGVHRSTTTRFHRGQLPLSKPVLSALRRLLHDVAGGRVVFPHFRRKRQIAETAARLSARSEALLDSLPAALRSSLDAIADLPADVPVARAVEDALVVLAMDRCHANMTAAAEILRVPRKTIARVWTHFERAQGATLGHPGMRTADEQTLRVQLAAALLAQIPAVLQAFVRKLTEHLAPGSGSTFAAAREIVAAHALGYEDGAVRVARLLRHAGYAVRKAEGSELRSGEKRIDVRGAREAQARGSRASGRTTRTARRHSFRVTLSELVAHLVQDTIDVVRQSSRPELTEFFGMGLER